MQFQICKLAMTMIEQEWVSTQYGESWLKKRGPIAEYAETIKYETFASWTHMDYGRRLASVWWCINKLKAHY
jgi:hypothetical protein